MNGMQSLNTLTLGGGVAGSKSGAVGVGGTQVPNRAGADVNFDVYTNTGGGLKKQASQGGLAGSAGVGARSNSQSVQAQQNVLMQSA